MPLSARVGPGEIAAVLGTGMPALRDSSLDPLRGARQSQRIEFGAMGRISNGSGFAQLVAAGPTSLTGRALSSNVGRVCQESNVARPQAGRISA